MEFDQLSLERIAILIMTRNIHTLTCCECMHGVVEDSTHLYFRGWHMVATGHGIIASASTVYTAAVLARSQQPAGIVFAQGVSHSNTRDHKGSRAVGSLL